MNRELVRRNRGAAAPLEYASPSVASVDAQPVKCSERGPLEKGSDSREKVPSRQGPPVVDTGDWLLAVYAGPGNENNRTGGRAFPPRL